MTKGLSTTGSLSFVQLHELKQQNYGFVARYINGGWKQMHYEEARRISDNSLYVVSLYQEYNNEAKCFSDQTGISQAKRALKLAASLKQPHDTPIYFAVDFDADADEIRNQIMSYFSGVSACFADPAENPNHYLIGVYGSNAVCKAVKEHFGILKIFTMVAAASTGWGGNKNCSFDEWDLRQNRVDRMITLAGRAVEIDECESSGHGGGWRLG